MSAYKIRSAVSGDISTIMSIEQEAGTAAHWPKTEYERIFEPGGAPRIALVVESDDEVSGFVVARCIDREWELENVAIREAARRKGFARGLIERLLQLAREAHAARIFLEVRNSNTSARNLYSQLGFVETGCRPAYYSHPVEDAITYEIVIGI